MRFSISVKTSLASGMCASFLVWRGWDRRGALQEQAGARLGKRGGAHRRLVFALKVLPVRDLGRHSEERERGHGGFSPPQLAQRRLKSNSGGPLAPRFAGP